MPALKGTTGPRGVDYLYDPTIAPVFDRVLDTVWDKNTIPIMNKTWYDTKNKIIKTFLIVDYR